MKWVRRAGFFFIALGLVPWGLWTLFDSTRTWSPAARIAIACTLSDQFLRRAKRENAHITVFFSKVESP
jgi:hypothetical protein